MPGGSVADAVVALDGDRLVLVRLSDNRTVVSNLGSMPLADVEIGPESVVLAAAPEAARLFDEAIDMWITLQAAALVGAAARALEITVDYATQRKAFGTPIGGAFQAVSHRLADSATAIDGARLLAYRAACAVVDEPDRASELAAMAFAFAYESARDVTYRGRPLSRRLWIHDGAGHSAVLPPLPRMGERIRGCKHWTRPSRCRALRRQLTRLPTEPALETPRSRRTHMPQAVEFEIFSLPPPSLELYRRSWRPEEELQLAGTWLGAVVSDSSGQDYWGGLRGTDDFLVGMTHVVSPICGFRKTRTIHGR